MPYAHVGVIGGSGLYRMEGMENITEYPVETLCGAPSDSLFLGTLEGMPVAFLPRHGRFHHLLPSEVPYRANILAMKQLGVRYLISVSAVGSLRAAIAPLHVVVPDQCVDLTRTRTGTFFGNGAVAHVSMANPFCPVLGDVLKEAVRHTDSNVTVHAGGTYVCIEGPQFSSRAESEWFRAMGMDIIGMTAMPEAKLAKEAQMAYATLAMVTDYDCWHPQETPVSTEVALANLTHNAALTQRVVHTVLTLLARRNPPSDFHHALRDALVTSVETIQGTQRDLVEMLLKGNN